MYDHCNVDENRHYQLANKHEYGDREYNYHHNGIDLYGTYPRAEQLFLMNIPLHERSDYTDR